MVKHLESFFQFLHSVIRHWRTLLTSSFVVLGVGVAQNFSPPGHELLFAALYASVGVVGLFAASYQAWNEQRREREKALAALPSELSSEWKEMEKRFTECINSGVRAHYFHYCLDGRDLWDFQGSSSFHTEQLKLLCEMAGKLLMKSTRLKLPDIVAATANNDWRWLYFVKTTYSYLGTFQEAAEVTKDDKQHTIMEWSVHDIAQLSAQACLKCAAVEL